MSDLELLAVGVTVGICLAFLALLAWWFIKVEIDRAVAEAKKEMREYVRNREDL